LHIDDAPVVDQSGDPFLRLNFEYDVQGLDEFLVKAVPSQRTPNRHRLNVVSSDRPLTKSEEAAQEFFDESVSWKLAWQPKDKRRVAVKRRREDEDSFSPGSGDASDRDDNYALDSPQKKKLKV
jgi:hypothetical protein